MRNFKWILLAASLALASGNAKAETLNYPLYLSCPNNWTFVTYDTTHPYWPQMLQAIETATNSYCNAVTPDKKLLQSPVSFSINNEAVVSGPQQIPLAAEYIALPGSVEKNAVFYNPLSSNVIVGANNQRNHACTAAPADPTVNYANPDAVHLEGLVHHEIGHLRYELLCPGDRDLWKEVWTLGMELWVFDIKPMAAYGYMDNGAPTMGNYFMVGDEEGFAVAWSRYQLGLPLEETYTNFFANLKNSVGRCGVDFTPLHL